MSEWFPERSGRYTGLDGSSVKQTIRLVYGKLSTTETDSNDKTPERKYSLMNEVAEAMSKSGQQQLTSAMPKSLLDLFEDAIDKYSIAAFVDADFTAMPLFYKDMVAVDVFVEVLRETLRAFRRNQDANYRHVMSFVNTLDQYQGFLSKRMFCDDGKRIHWLPRIDWSEVHEATLQYRRELDRLYGLISDGGTLSVFGYPVPLPSTEEPWEINRDYYNLFVVSDEIKNNRFSISRDRALQGDSESVNHR